MQQQINSSSPSKIGHQQQKAIQKLEVIDNIIERKIGFGDYHKKALAFLCLIDFNDGLELILMSLTLPIIKNEWNKLFFDENDPSSQYIDSTKLKWLGSVFFFGNLIGAILTGPLSDKFGRRRVVLVNSISYGVVALCFWMVQNLEELFILRFIYGLIYGITLPISTTFYSEIAPTKMRGKGVIIINSAIAIGLIFGVIISSIILTDTTSGNWRLLISVSAIPAFVLFYGAYNHLLESPRFLVVDRRIQEAADVMNQMITINKGDGGEVITSDEMEQLEKWRARKYDNYLGQNQLEQMSASLTLVYKKIGQLFQDKYTLISISLCIQWFGIHFMSIGQIFILPLIQEQAKKGFGEMFLTYLGEVPGFLTTYFIIDKVYFGRKNSLVIFFTSCLILNLLAFYQIQFGIILGLSRFCYRQCHGVLYVITNEIYETPLRTTGIGFNSALGRLSTVVMPFILVAIYEYSTYGPFLMFSIISAICAIMAYKLPFDTSNMKLDHVDEELEIIMHPELNHIDQEQNSPDIKKKYIGSPGNNNLKSPLIQQV